MGKVQIAGIGPDHGDGMSAGVSDGLDNVPAMRTGKAQSPTAE